MFWQRFLWPTFFMTWHCERLFLHIWFPWWFTIYMTYIYNGRTDASLPYDGFRWCWEEVVVRFFWPFLGSRCECGALLRHGSIRCCVGICYFAWLAWQFIFWRNWLHPNGLFCISWNGGDLWCIIAFLLGSHAERQFHLCVVFFSHILRLAVDHCLWDWGLGILQAWYKS